MIPPKINSQRDVMSSLRLSGLFLMLWSQASVDQASGRIQIDDEMSFESEIGSGETPGVLNYD